MKKRTSTIMKVTMGIAVVAIVGFCIKNYIGNKVEKVSETVYEMYVAQPVQRMDLETFSRGSGLFSSFNTADIKMEDGQKITKQYVNDGDGVIANQTIFLVNNGYESSYVKTPIAGLFFETQGENSATTYQVYDTSNTGVLIQVSEENVAKLQIGQNAKVLFTAIDKEFDGTVSYISKVANGGNFPVRISVPYNEELRFGYNGSVKIITASKSQTLCVPYNTVQFEGDQAYVLDAKYVKDLNKTNTITDEMKKYITVGASDSDFVEVLEGLRETDQVLVRKNY